MFDDFAGMFANAVAQSLFACLVFGEQAVGPEKSGRPPIRLLRAGKPPALPEHCLAVLRYAAHHAGRDRRFVRHMRLKVGHTFSVLRQAREIARQEKAFADAVLRRAYCLAALYHDLGRFPQYARYRTFDDARSVNHGQAASREIALQGFLDGETPEVRRLVRAAAVLHNRLALPENLPERVRIVTQGVRDADKIDAMRVLRKNLEKGAKPDPVVVLHVRNSPEYSRRMLDAVSSGKLGLYADMATTTDFCLLLCSWFYDLGFDASRRAMLRSGHLDAIIAALPDEPALNSFVGRFYGELGPWR